MEFFSWLYKQLYDEEDPWKLVASAVAIGGFLFGLIYYEDMAIAFGIALFPFVLIRILGYAVQRLAEWKKEKPERDKFKSLGNEEKSAVKEFVNSGSEFMTREEILDWPSDVRNGVDSLIDKGIIRRSPGAGYKGETFNLDTDLFNYANKVLSKGFY